MSDFMISYLIFVHRPGSISTKNTRKTLMLLISSPLQGKIWCFCKFPEQSQVILLALFALHAIVGNHVSRNCVGLQRIPTVSGSEVSQAGQSPVFFCKCAANHRGDGGNFVCRGPGHNNDTPRGSTTAKYARAE